MLNGEERREEEEKDIKEGEEGGWVGGRGTFRFRTYKQTVEEGA